MEEWRNIPSLPGYQASSLGRICSVPRVVTDTRGRSYDIAGVVLVLNLARNGYLRFNAAGSSHHVHTVVLEAFVGPRPEGHQGAHRNGNKLNCELANLRWATPSENAQDKALHGTVYRPTGEKHHMARLTEAVVIEIRRRAEGETQRAIAADLGIDYRTVNSVVRRKTWKHVQQSDMRSMGKVG